MRVLVCLALLLPIPAFADTILATSTITAVTVYPSGAQITREVNFQAPAGAHELLVTDLPSGVEPDLIRLSGTDGFTLGAFSLRSDRLPPRPKQTSPELDAARVAVEALQVKQQAALRAVSEVNARVEAAEAQIRFLRLVEADTGERTVEDLKSIGQMIAAEVLAARQAALLAQADLPAAEKALTAVQDELAEAQATYVSLAQGDAEYVALSVAMDQKAAGEVTLVVSHFVADANWAPVYDMTLARKVPSLTIERGVLVAQNSGEDWAGVDLTLSTAQPSAWAAPSEVYPQVRRIITQAELDQMSKDAESDAEAGGLDEPVMEPAVVEADVGFKAYPELLGDIVVYHYPTPVNLASSVDSIRLALDKIDVTPTIEARAVPRNDATAFLVASFTNDSKEILLPGTAYLLRDGTLVGSTYFGKVAPGAKTEVPFGPIEGLRLSRDMPLRAEGDSGIISTTNQVAEKAVMSVENLTDEVWPVRLLDQVPYSEQEDLEFSYSADPARAEVM